ncbi:hypothetical protein PTNB73_07582 [Pyrenophora teres f. teres]|uniref:Caps synth domain containing protein n=1 Tax=Pyrenophora teres f. teres TaxID=97479 RepID=A0A6S6WDQ5_9PLEO|nr:hypothetical protein PTNB85_09296 [Pyrenophora teres f. teres]KAE8832031.1 hypothetical protein HRS9139_06273 [Pyrenophora teres f. teres]KAE8858134.1 hypothetical protein PTNB29_07349 [Pyrenophora teres f. teres]KAE8862028.1 hypothetical protein PTNB73_07582 [Pyrenophora teres f. teres]CAE7208163.1 Caps synth domain containing protein [Pyrenophora teres f. teres]
MANQIFQILEQYKTQLHYVESNDARTDSETLDSLTHHAPITTEKYIWTYWHSGLQNMPTWSQRNIINWVRLHGPDWTVRVLDKVPNSPNHALTWIPPENLPEAFVKGTMTGPYIGPHSADFLRGAALYEYGGVWMDVGCIVFRRLDKVCWDRLADEASPFTVATPFMFVQYTANHFVASRKGDMFISNWHKIFLELWKGRTDFTGVIQSPFVGFMKLIDLEDVDQAGYIWEWKLDDQTVFGYIGQVIAWMRLTWLQEPNDGFDGVNYWANRVL